MVDLAQTLEAEGEIQCGFEIFRLKMERKGKQANMEAKLSISRS